MIFKTGIYKDNKLWVRIFRCPYPISKPTNKFEALFIQVGHKGYWIFRNQEIFNNWPVQS